MPVRMHMSSFPGTDVRLQYLAGALAPAFVRVGGTGKDETCYDFPGSKEPGCHRASTQTQESGPLPPTSVMNTTAWRALISFANICHLDLVFGLNALTPVSERGASLIHDRSYLS
jgi:hypothetical protein